MTRAKFARATYRDIEDQIMGAQFRHELARDLATWNAIASLAKWTDSNDQPQPLTIRLMLGRDEMDLDERVTTWRHAVNRVSPYEAQVKAEQDAAVRARLDKAEARRRERGS